MRRLLEEPFRFQFFQAVRILEMWLRRHGAPGDTHVADRLRFRNSLSLSFPASEIESLEVEGAELEQVVSHAAQPPASEPRPVFVITPAFMGFLGSCGALPSHYTERIAAHALFARDQAPRAFLDVFSNRVLLLLYEAWRKYRFECKYTHDEREDILVLLRAFAGIGQRSLARRLEAGAEGVADEALAGYAAALRHRPASAVLIQSVLNDYFGVPVVVRQFIGCWYALPDAQQTRLGLVNAVLGATALAGARIWQRDLCLRLRIGPLARREFKAFLPGGKGAKVLEKLLAMFTGLTLEYEVQLVLRREDVCGVRLAVDEGGGNLGWDTFLSPPTDSADREDVRYRLHAIA